MEEAYERKTQDAATDDPFLKLLQTTSYYNVSPDVQSQKAENVYASIMMRDHRALNDVLLKALTPKLVENEEQKQKFKEQLMKFLKRMIWAQLCIVSAPVILFCLVAAIDFPWANGLFLDNIKVAFDFLKFYITAITGEFIAMLFFIVKYVFDKSIVDLISHYVKK